MGQAKLRRANDPLYGQTPEDARAKIALAVHSVVLPPLGTCLTRAVLTELALRTLNIPAELMIGAMIYRAGPDERRDVIAFCGPHNQAYLRGIDADLERGIRNIPGIDNGGFLGHVWIKSRNSLVDFSPSDWPALAEVFQDMDGLGAIEWQAKPPAFYWQSWESLTEPWRPTGSPEIGRVWYKPGIALTSPLQQAEVERQYGAMASEALDRIRDLGLFRVVANNLRQLGLLR